ncbi:hypothetical protein HBH53_229030 [Parastagonospora nodorum]|nr:hypothetical protein HBH53_229030 [Parastagonospora nodorum]KAH5527184.1 hypothetical protein HBI27_237170 [Parastagonospora nodorum]
MAHTPMLLNSPACEGSSLHFKSIVPAKGAAIHRRRVQLTVFTRRESPAMTSLVSVPTAFNAADRKQTTARFSVSCSPAPRLLSYIRSAFYISRLGSIAVIANPSLSSHHLLPPPRVLLLVMDMSPTRMLRSSKQVPGPGLPDDGPNEDRMHRAGPADPPAQASTSQSAKAKGKRPVDHNRHGDESDDQSVIITGSGPAPARQQNPFMTPALTFAGHRNGHLARRIKRQEKRHSDELRRMSAVLSQCQGELAAARQESRLYQDELVTARQELGIYQDALVTARQESGDYQDELAAARQESGDYQDELAVARQDLGLYQDALAAARQESSDYQDAFAAARQESGDSQDELAAARQESSDYQDELAAARQELGDYHDELAAADEEFSIMQTNIRETQFHHSVQRCQDCAGKIEDSDIYVYDHCGAFRCGKCVRQHGEIACLQHEELGPQGMHRVYGGLECTLGTCEESEDPRRLHDLPCGHPVCMPCALKWVQYRDDPPRFQPMYHCPLCLTSLPSDQLALHPTLVHRANDEDARRTVA